MPTSFLLRASNRPGRLKQAVSTRAAERRPPIVSGARRQLSSRHITSAAKTHTTNTLNTTSVATKSPWLPGLQPRLEKNAKHSPILLCHHPRKARTLFACYPKLSRHFPTGLATVLIPTITAPLLCEG